MEKLMFFVLVVFAFCGCCVDRVYECVEVWENHEVECCGVEDPLNNLEWLKETHLYYKSRPLYDKVEILCLKYENKITKEHSILFYKHKVYPRYVTAYSCNGEYYFGGTLGSSPQYIDIFTYSQSVTRSSEPMEPHMGSDIWNTFVQENVLVDTLAIYAYE